VFRREFSCKRKKGLCVLGRETGRETRRDRERPRETERERERQGETERKREKEGLPTLSATTFVAKDLLRVKGSQTRKKTLLLFLTHNCESPE